MPLRISKFFKIIVPFIKIYCAICGLLIFSLLAIFTYGHLTNPHITEIEHIKSPNSSWDMIVEGEEYSSVFSPYYYGIVLKPTTGLFKKFREKQIFEAVYSNGFPQVKWLDDKNILVKTTSKTSDITVKILEYKNIRITYDIPK